MTDRLWANRGRRVQRSALGMVRTVLRDGSGIARVFGPLVAVRWLGAIVRHGRACARARNLGPADRALGSGPFRARHRGARAVLSGPEIMTNAREIWVRDVYLGGGFLEIPDDAVVLDLGARRGMFTLLALAHAPHGRVVAVEADPDFAPLLRRAVEENGWSDRARIVTAFVGGRDDFQRALLERAEVRAVPWLDEATLLRDGALDRIDFLKCDIEGSEFDLLAADSRLLAMTDRIALELHRLSGDADALLARLEDAGFTLRVSHDSPDDLVVLGRRS